MKKLYKYRRLAGIFLLAGAVAIGTHTQAKDINNQPNETVYIVQPGDTLWSIASQHCTDEENILEFIHSIKTKNNIISANLNVGQKIKIGSRPHESQFLNQNNED